MILQDIFKQIFFLDLTKKLLGDIERQVTKYTDFNIVVDQYRAHPSYRSVPMWHNW